jgi:hypothetical protein
MRDADGPTEPRARRILGDRAAEVRKAHSRCEGKPRQGDLVGMDREAKLSMGKGGADMIVDRQAFVFAYSGHLQEAKKMARRAADLNQQPAEVGRKALIEIGPALWDALFGNLPAATTSAADHSNDRDVEYGAAFALAFSLESPRSRALAKRSANALPVGFGRPIYLRAGDSRTP